MSHHHNTSAQRPSALLVVGAVLSVITSGGCSEETPSEQTVVSASDQPERQVQELEVSPVISAGLGVFVIRGAAAGEATAPASRWEVLGSEVELAIAARPELVPVRQFTLVSEHRICVADSGQPIALWIVRRGDRERLTEVVEAVELEGCDELEYGEWLAAVSGVHQDVQWRAPEYEASYQGRAELDQVVASLQGDPMPERVSEESMHLARFDLAGTELSALVLGEVPIDRNLRRSSRSCEAEEQVTVSLVRQDHIVVTFPVGEQLGVLTVGDQSFVVHLTRDRTMLQAWQVQNEGLALVTETRRPSFHSSAPDC